MRKLNIYSNRNNNPFENTVNTFGQSQTEQSYGLGSENQNQSLSWPQNYGLGSKNQTKSNNIPRYWETAADGEKVWNYVQQQEGDVEPKNQNKLGYGIFGALVIRNMINNKDKLANQPYTDKYKHALINCKAAQYGEGGYDAANVLSFLKEARDVVTRQNTLDSSFADNYAKFQYKILGWGGNFALSLRAKLQNLNIVFRFSYYYMFICLISYGDYYAD